MTQARNLPSARIVPTVRAIIDPRCFAIMSNLPNEGTPPTMMRTILGSCLIGDCHVFRPPDLVPVRASFSGVLMRERKIRRFYIMR